MKHLLALFYVVCLAACGLAEHIYPTNPAPDRLAFFGQLGRDNLVVTNVPAVVETDPVFTAWKGTNTYVKTEADPTVPSWAKAANPPSENDPTVPAWAKAANPPAVDFSTNNAALVSTITNTPTRKLFSADGATFITGDGNVFELSPSVSWDCEDKDYHDHCTFYQVAENRWRCDAFFWGNTPIVGFLYYDASRSHWAVTNEGGTILDMSNSGGPESTTIDFPVFTFTRFAGAPYFKQTKRLAYTNDIPAQIVLTDGGKVISANAAGRIAIPVHFSIPNVISNYSSSVTYHIGDIVKQSSKYWYCLVEGTYRKTPSASSTYWLEVSWEVTKKPYLYKIGDDLEITQGAGTRKHVQLSQTDDYGITDTATLDATGLRITKVETSGAGKQLSFSLYPENSTDSAELLIYDTDSVGTETSTIVRFPKNKSGVVAFTDDVGTIATNVVRAANGGVWDGALSVWWTPVMSNGKLTYQATTNVNLNAGN